jgi:tRNA(fMet)-specific endonuclease VapC
LVIADFDSEAAVSYGQIRANLESLGTPIGTFDTLIAAHALSLGAALVTNTLSEFKRVPKLNVVNWVVP